MRARLAAALGPSVLAAAVSALLAFGVAGVGRSGPWQADLDFSRVAGRLWARGHSPYVPETFVAEMQTIGRSAGDAAFPYPPQVAPLCLLLGALPLAAALLVGGWVAVRRGREVWGGLLLGLAVFKPHFALLPLFWLLLERRVRALAAAASTVAASTVVAFAAPGLRRFDPLGELGLWLRAVPTYRVDTANRLGSEYVVRIPSGLAALALARLARRDRSPRGAGPIR